MRVRIAILVHLLALAIPVAGRAGDDVYELRVELGGELDSNPTRVEQMAGLPTMQPSTVARLVGMGSYGTRLSDRVSLSLSGGVGGKRFTADTVAGEDVLVAQSQNALSVFLNERHLLSVSFNYYDAFQRGQRESRAFRSIAPSARIERRLGESSRIATGLGYRHFRFKPDDAFSFSAPTFLAQFRQAFPGDILGGGADWEWSGLATLEVRRFEGPACSLTTCGGHQSDAFATANAEAVRVGAFLAGGGLSVHLNRSNAFGQSLVRGIAHLRAVVPLPLSLSLSTRLEVVRTRYQEKLTYTLPVSGMATASIEDENRSSLRVELARDIGGDFEVGARYAYYTSLASSGGMDFRRQTILFFVAAKLEP